MNRRSDPDDQYRSLLPDSALAELDLETVKAARRDYEIALRRMAKNIEDTIDSLRAALKHRDFDLLQSIYMSLPPEMLAVLKRAEKTILRHRGVPEPMGKEGLPEKTKGGWKVGDVPGVHQT